MLPWPELPTRIGSLPTERRVEAWDSVLVSQRGTNERSHLADVTTNWLCPYLLNVLGSADIVEVLRNERASTARK